MNAQQLAAHVAANPEQAQRFAPPDPAFYAPGGAFHTLVEAENRKLRIAIETSQANAAERALR